MSKDKTMHFCETIEAVTPATEELRHLLDEREIKYCDYYRSLTYFRLIPDVEDDFFTTVEETHTHRLILKVGFKSPKQAVDAIQAIAATLGSEDTYTREDVEGAFVSGYSLGLDMFDSSKPDNEKGWNQNERNLDEEMEDLGWVRKDAATLDAGTCHEIEDEDTGFIVCSECGAVHDTDYTNYYCWCCGRKVMDE